MKAKFFVLLMFPFFGSAQIFVDNTNVDNTINDFFVGQGVFISNLQFNGMPFDTSYSQVGYFISGSSGFPFDLGIIMGTGNVVAAIGPNDQFSATNNTGVAADPNDPDLDAISTVNMLDEAVLEFDFIPAGDSIVFEYIFASEEYFEYSPSIFNDVFGFFISGPGISGPYANMAENIALIPGTNLTVSINNINNGVGNAGPCTNCAYLVDNTGGLAVEYDAYTTVMTASSSVICGEVYHLKLVIADAGDHAYDSGIFLKGSSFISNGLGLSISGQEFTYTDLDLSEGCDTLGFSIQLPYWSLGTSPVINITTGGNAIKDVDYVISDTLISFGPGDTILPFYIHAFADNLIEPNDSLVLQLQFLTPCNDTFQLEKIIHLIDHTSGTLSLTDQVISCAGDIATIEPLLTDITGTYVTYWSTGDTSQILTIPIVSDTVLILELYDGCGLTPLVDTAYVDLLSDLSGSLSGPMICYDDTLASIYFSGTADSLSWGNDTLTAAYTGSPFYDIYIYDLINNCVDTITYEVILYPIPANPIIHITGDTLYTNSMEAYQWYLNGNLIPSTDSIAFIISDTGYYQVQVWDTNGCSAISDSIYVMPLSVDKSLNIPALIIYPNPSNGIITLELRNNSSQSSILIYTMEGQLLASENTSGMQKIELDLQTFAQGTYLICFIADETTTETQQLIIARD